MNVYIYALVDPRDGQVRYVGKTNNVKERLYYHCRLSREDFGVRKKRWMLELKDKGLRPEIIVLEVADKDTWRECERYWISYFRGKVDLLNVREGGETGYVFHSDEIRKQLSRLTTEQFSTPEARQQHGEATRTGMATMSAESRAKVLEGAKVLERTRTSENQSKRSKSYWDSMTPEQREQFIAMRNERLHTPEAKQRHKEGQAKRDISAELRDVWARRKAGLLPLRRPKGQGVSH